MDANLNVLSTLSAVDFMLSAPTDHYGDKVSDGYSTDTLLLNPSTKSSFCQISDASVQFRTGPMLTRAAANRVSAPPTWALTVLVLALMGTTLAARASKFRCLASDPR